MMAHAHDRNERRGNEKRLVAAPFLPFPNRRPPLKVLLTVDVELYPNTPDWQTSSLREQMKQYIWGEVSTGEELGLRYQLDVLKRHGLRAAFMVEALHTLAAGPDQLKKIVSTIREADQEVQLHTHTEWLEPLDPAKRPVVGAKPNLGDYSLAEQEALIRIGLSALERAGASPVVAHRAGNFGANNDTLVAMARAGLAYDTSYNACYLDRDCKMRFDELLTGALAYEGVIELPVGWFYDLGGHKRHVQICACSLAELKHALWEAWRAGWSEIVIVSHSFELIRRGIRRGRDATPRRVVVHRFKRLCEHLDRHRSYFQTVGFGNLAARAAEPPPIRSNALRTAGRFMEQIVGRVL